MLLEQELSTANDKCAPGPLCPICVVSPLAPSFLWDQERGVLHWPQRDFIAAHAPRRSPKQLGIYWVCLEPSIHPFLALCYHILSTLFRDPSSLWLPRSKHTYCVATLSPGHMKAPSS